MFISTYALSIYIISCQSRETVPYTKQKWGYTRPYNEQRGECFYSKNKRCCGSEPNAIWKFRENLRNGSVDQINYKILKKKGSFVGCT